MIVIKVFILVDFFVVVEVMKDDDLIVISYINFVVMKFDIEWLKKSGCNLFSSYCVRIVV